MRSKSAGEEEASLLPAPKTRLFEIETWAKINAWRSGAMMRPIYVAVLLRCSEETLQTLRRKGTGPAYLKLGVKMRAGAEEAGDNQHIVYEKQDVVDWFRANRLDLDWPELYHEDKVKAIKRFETAADLARLLPFWIGDDQRVAGLVEDSPIEEFFERAAAEWGIKWLPAAEAGFCG